MGHGAEREGGREEEGWEENPENAWEPRESM